MQNIEAVDGKYSLIYILNCLIDLHLHLPVIAMPLRCDRRLLEVETSNANQATIDELGPIALAGIKVVPLAIAFMDKRGDAQGVLQWIAEVLVQEVVEGLSAILEHSHVLIGAVGI